MTAHNAALGHALITGATSGIGAALSRLFAADGIDLVLVARSAGGLETIACELERDFNIRTLTVAADLSHPDAPTAVTEAVHGSGIQVGYLINNAGVELHGHFSAIPLDRELAMMRLNMDAVVMLTKELLPPMRARGKGRILNVASLAALQPGGPGAAVCYATKAFILSFSQGLAAELEGSGVSVTALCPGPVDTGVSLTGDVSRNWLYGKAMANSAEAVACIGYRAMHRGNPVCIPGLLAKVLAVAGQQPPRRIALRINGLLLRLRKG